MHVDFVTYQPGVRAPSRPDSEQIFRVFPEAKRCPLFSATVAAGLWVYPPFDALVQIDKQGNFRVVTDQALDALVWLQRMETLVSWPSTWWCSKIPGVLQIDPGFIMITPPGKRLIVTQPINLFGRHFQTQTGAIDSDFFWAPFTINLVPNPGVSEFELRRSQPIAHLLNPEEMLAPLSFKVSSIEERPEPLQFWRSYIEAVYGAECQPDCNGLTKRQNSVYREWLLRHRRVVEKSIKDGYR